VKNLLRLSLVFGSWIKKQLVQGLRSCKHHEADHRTEQAVGDVGFARQRFIRWHFDPYKPIDWRLGLLLILHLALVTGCIFRYGYAWTETGLLASGLIDWRIGQYDHFRVNPPLVRMWATAALFDLDLSGWDIPTSDDPRLRLEWTAARELFNHCGLESISYLRIARLSCLPFVALGFCVAVRWSGQLYGSAAAIGAGLIFCFYPSLIAYGALISGDAQAASMGLTTLYLFRRWLDRSDLFRSYSLGLVLGLTVLTKTSWLILFVLLPLLWMMIRGIEHWLSRNRLLGTPVAARQIGRELMLSVLVLIVSLTVVNSIYGFKGSFRRLGDYQFVSKLLTKNDLWRPDEFSGNRFTGTWCGELTVPFPEDFVIGVDLQKWDFDRERWSYFAGQWREHGWWYYHLFGLVAKTPLGLLLVAAVSILGAWRFTAWRGNWRDELVLLTPAVILLSLASAETGLNRHLRYVLPIVPMLIVSFSRAFVCFTHRTRLRWLVGFGCGAMVISSLSVYPYGIAYFNSLVGGVSRAPNWYNASNIGWGEDLLNLKRWHDQNPAARPLFVQQYLHLIDPKAMEIESIGSVPSYPTSANPLRAKVELPIGWYAIDRESLLSRDGSYHYLNGVEIHSYVGMNFLIYRITPAIVARLRETETSPKR